MHVCMYRLMNCAIAHLCFKYVNGAKVSVLCVMMAM